MFFCYSLVACESLTTPSMDIINKEKMTITPDLLVNCEEIPPINGVTITLGELMTYSTDMMYQYNVCATRLDQLIKKVTPKE